MEKIDYSLQRLLRRTYPQLPVLVVYNMPNRDIGQYSKGGAKTRESYLNFLKSFADGIGKNKPILIYEPDSLVHTTEMSKEDSEARLSLMKEGLQVLTNNCNALIYIDIGHSNWLSPVDASKLLNKVTNNKVRGFAVNVSNYRSNTESMKWSLELCEHRPNDYFVIDTSRNGNGPMVTIGVILRQSIRTPPTCDTGEEKCDAFLWIKIPGESDGKANKGPRAGRFWGEMAEELVRNT